MASKTEIFVDTSWFKGLVDESDDFHSEAYVQMKKVKDEKLLLLASNFIVDESLTLIRVKADLKTAMEFRDILFEMQNILKIIRITSQDEKEAWNWFPKDWSKLSFTDCTSFAVMQRLGLEEVLTFDDHFAQAGFKIFK